MLRYSQSWISRAIAARRLALVENHPVNAEPIAHLTKARGKERLLYRQQDLTTVGKRCDDALSTNVAIHTQCQVSAPHWLGVGDVRRHQFSVANRNACMQHGVLPLRFDAALIGRLTVRHHGANFCSEMLFVVPEGLRATAREIHIGIHFHCSISCVVDEETPRKLLCQRLDDFGSATLSA